MAQGELTTFLCLFHNQDHAEEAMSALEKAGFHRNAITAVGRKGDDAEIGSLQEELTQLGAPQRDLQRLKDGIAHGGVVLGLDAAESRTEQIEKIFHRYSADKIDEVDESPANDYAAAPAASGVQDPALVVPVAVEELAVGTREVDRGGVRVFRRTVEEPASEAVSLHEEHVTLDRRPTDRAATPADLAAGGQVIELTETDEVPVISKVARVVEEIRLDVVGSDHVETVHDSVRHTEVEVESLDDGRTGKTAASQPLSDQKY